MTNPVLVEIYRNEVLESFHRGVVCIVNEKNEIVFSLGDVDQVCYPRSAMKLMQALPLLERGGLEHFGFTLEEIAVMCGSHNAEQRHLEVVRSILKKIDCTENDLLCGAQYPTAKKEANELIRTGQKPSAIHNNCSGKHAGMLALCKLIGAPISDYINPDHPIQQLIRSVCLEMYEMDENSFLTALDGCSAPIFSVPVKQQAIGFKNLVAGKGFSTNRLNACKTVIEAVSAFPFMVAGTNRYCTDMMNITAPTVIGKTGAEGIFCMAFPKQKLGVCIKIDDGKMSPQYNVAQAILIYSGLFSTADLKELEHYYLEPITNFNKLQTGWVETNDSLFENDVKRVFS